MSSRRLRFDGWLLDPESGDLEREGARIRLQEQPARVLQELIAHAGNVVTREQLIVLLTLKAWWTSIPASTRWFESSAAHSETWRIGHATVDTAPRDVVTASSERSTPT